MIIANAINPPIMLHTLENLTMTDLCVQVGEWSLRNFGTKQASDLGVLEEIGELTHGVLKRYQGIRGFDDPLKFTAHVEDALGDIGIYLLNIAGTNNLLISHQELSGVPLGFNDRICIIQLLQAVAQLIDFTDREGALIPASSRDNLEILRGLVQLIWDWASTWACSFGFDLRVVTTKTWLKVRQRDWNKNKTHAHIIAESGGTEVPAVPGTVDTNGDVGSVPPESGVVSLPPDSWTGASTL